MKKCCFMHFKPKGPSLKKNLDQPEVPPIKINDFEIKEVDNTKFLGVTIDNEYSWIPRLTTLAKKLRCCTWAAKHLPASLHKLILIHPRTYGSKGQVSRLKTDKI